MNVFRLSVCHGLDPYHETVHVLTRGYGSPPAAFTEGLAVYMSERLGARALRNLGGGDSALYERARDLRNQGEWIPLGELLTYTDIGPAKSRPPVSYAEAGAFVKFLIEAHGKERFLKAYQSLQSASSPAVHEQNAKRLAEIYGSPVAELEREWIEALSSKRG